MGRLQRREIVYTQWHGDALLVVNGMPAIICDVCGEQAYDEQALEYLQRLLWSSVPGQSSSPFNNLA